MSETSPPPPPEMRTARIVLGGLARNCAKYLPDCLTWLRAAHRDFHPDSRFLFVTNDSSDETPALLEAFATEYPEGTVKIYRMDGLTARIPARTHRLAYCRNLFLNHIRSRHADFDFMILADLDDTTANFDPLRLRTCFDPAQTPAQWDVLTAAARPTYYDIWALRSRSIGLTYDCWDAIRHDQLRGVLQNQAIQRHIDPFRVPHATMTAPIEVESAFGGLGLYRVTATADCSYTGVPPGCSVGETSTQCMREICEHVPFHTQMRERNGARIWIFPPLFVTPMN